MHGQPENFRGSIALVFYTILGLFIVVVVGYALSG